MHGDVKKLILVASGKGGVGKSTVAVNLALGLAQRGLATGLLDADIYGPSIPTMLGEAELPKSDGETLKPITKHGIKVMSIGYLVDPSVAMLWRGPMLAGAVQQFLNDVDWGDLDYLVLDLPPGTGDIQLTVAQKVKVTGAVLVTTPQSVALADVLRAKAMLDKVRIRALGLVENMSYFVCPSCDERHEIFSCGGGEKSAAELDVPFLGRVPIETRVRECGDAGEPVLAQSPDSASAKAFADIVGRLVEVADVAAAEDQRREKQRQSLRVISA